MDQNIRIIKLINGDDIVCKVNVANLADKNDPQILLELPYHIKYVPKFTDAGIKDYIALVRFVGYTMDKFISVPRDKIITITSASDEMRKAFTDIAKTYSLRVPQPIDNNKEKPLMTKEDNDEFNELWETFKDDEGTIH